MVLKKKLKKKRNQKRNSSNYLLLILVYYFLILLYEVFTSSLKGFFLTIPLALFLVFYLSYKFSEQSYSFSEFISSIIFLLVLGLGPFGIYDFSFFGVTGDVYIHLLAGFFATRWLLNFLVRMKLKRVREVSFLLMIFFSVGVELYEFSMTYLFSPKDLNALYLQDTLNDLLNDFIGIMLGLIRNK